MIATRERKPRRTGMQVMYDPLPNLGMELAHLALVTPGTLLACVRENLRQRNRSG